MDKELILGILIVIGLTYLLIKFGLKGGNLTYLELAPIGYYLTSTGRLYDLSYYYVDKDENLYSRNPLTWEVNPVKSRDILKCSDSSVDKQGYIVNSMRSTKGWKVTIRRKNLKFEYLKSKNGSIMIQPKWMSFRHLKVLGTNQVKQGA